MDLYADATGLTRLRDFAWEPYAPPTAPPPAATASPPPATVEKREAKRRRTLAERKAEATATASAVSAATYTHRASIHPVPARRRSLR